MKHYQSSNYYITCLVLFLLTLLSGGCSDTLENKPIVSVDKFRMIPSSKEFFSPGETEDITIDTAGTYTYSLSVGQHTDSGQQRFNFDGYEGTSWVLAQTPDQFNPHIMSLFFPEILSDTSNTTILKIFVAGKFSSQTFRVKLQATGPTFNTPKELLLRINLVGPPPLSINIVPDTLIAYRGQKDSILVKVQGIAEGEHFRVEWGSPFDDAFDGRATLRDSVFTVDTTETYLYFDCPVGARQGFQGANIYLRERTNSYRALAYGFPMIIY